jgi:hypothetical protein
LEITVSKTEKGDFQVFLTTRWDELFNESITMVNNRQKEQSGRELASPEQFILSHIAISSFPFPRGNLAFIPAGRILYSSIEESQIPREQKIADIFISRFSDLCGFMRKMFSRYDISSPHWKKRISPNVLGKILFHSKNILGGVVEFNDNKCYLSLPSEDAYIQIINASSGQQESIWILLYVLFFFDTSGNCTVVEEPEAHLFPTPQRDMMYVLTLLANQDKNQLMLTTHSPYILTPLNNLLLAHQIGQNKREAVEKIVDPDLWIDPERFECYYVDKGCIHSVMDRDTGIMDLAGLDAVSSMLNEQYDRLTELED